MNFVERSRLAIEAAGEPAKGHAWAARGQGLKMIRADAVPVVARSKSGDLWCYRLGDIVPVIEVTTGLAIAWPKTAAHARRFMAAIDGRGAELVAASAASLDREPGAKARAMAHQEELTRIFEETKKP